MTEQNKHYYEPKMKQEHQQTSFNPQVWKKNSKSPAQPQGPAHGERGVWPSAWLRKGQKRNRSHQPLVGTPFVDEAGATASTHGHDLLGR